MVTTAIAYAFVAAVLAFCFAPVSKVLAAIKGLRDLAGKGKEKIVSRSQEWKDAFSKKEEDSAD